MDIHMMLEKFSNSTTLPVQIYENDSVVENYNTQPYFDRLTYQLIEPYLQSVHNICFFCTEDYLQCGYIRIHDASQLLLLGPASVYEPSPGQAENFLKRLRLPQNRRAEILKWFHHLPVMSIKKFRETLDFLNYIINGTSDEPIRVSYHAPLINLHSASCIPAFMDSFSLSAEQQILPCIERGDCETLGTFLNSLSGVSHLPNLATSDLRSLKNSFIASAAIASRVAVKGGLDYDMALSLSDYYIGKAESMTLFADIISLLRSMLMDYTRRVANARSLQADSATVNMICKYVNAHLTEKISAKYIADELHLNKTYISHHFKESTGISLSEYICQQKIKEAQFLLRTSSLPLHEIAERLAFSSQQYFQTIFKKYTGMTPKQYRSQKA